MYYDNDADAAALKGARIAILGFGSQGHAHAINLKESGHDVVVGLPPQSRSRAAVKEAGLEVLDPADAVKGADVVMILVPDTSQADLYESAVAPNLKEGAMLMFAHGFNIHFGQVQPRPRSKRRPKPISSASRRSSAGAYRAWSRRVSTPSWMPGTSPSWPTSKCATSSS